MSSSRRTHYALAVASKTDNAKLSVRASYPPCCNMYFACNEGAGTTITDFSKSGVVMTNASGGATVVFSSGAGTVVMAGTNPVPSAGTVVNIDLTADSSFVFFKSGLAHAAGAAIGAMQIGSLAGPNVRLDEDTVTLDDGTDTFTVNCADEVAGSDKFFVAGVVDRVANTFTAYQGINAGAMTTSTDIAAGTLASIGDIVPTNAMTLAGGGVSYGGGIFVFSDGIPSNIADILDKLRTAIYDENATKVLPVELLALL